MSGGDQDKYGGNREEKNKGGVTQLKMMNGEEKAEEILK